MKTILVTGGAGYIGSHACKILASKGYTPVTFDNLSTGWKEAVKFGPFSHGDLLDRSSLDAAFALHRPDAVMHFAAFSQVGEAMNLPGKYWRNNLAGTLNLVEAAVAADCLDFVFSSTCAVYGDQDGVTLDENSSINPTNAYGASKSAIENLIRDFGASDGLRSVVFRYFNVAGADPTAEIGEFHDPETHLIPVILEAIDGKRSAITIHGTDYETPDGTCIRDYVHVMDLCEAHVLGLEYLAKGLENRVFNLGTGTGFSVRDVLGVCEEVVGKPVPQTEGSRRKGDATCLVSGGQRVEDELGWKPKRSTLPIMIRDALRWHQTGGYPREKPCKNLN